MTTPLFLLRCKQLGLTLTELDLLTIGIINNMFTTQSTCINKFNRNITT